MQPSMEQMSHTLQLVLRAVDALTLTRPISSSSGTRRRWRAEVLTFLSRFAAPFGLSDVSVQAPSKVHWMKYLFNRQ